MKQTNENVLFIITGLFIMGLLYSRIVVLPELLVILLMFTGLAAFLNGLTESVNMINKGKKREKREYSNNSFKKRF
jgi:hypothetical protein